MISKLNQVDNNFQPDSVGLKKLFHTVKEFSLISKINECFSQCEMKTSKIHIVKNVQKFAISGNDIFPLLTSHTKPFSHCDSMKNIFSIKLSRAFFFSQCEKKNAPCDFCFYLPFKSYKKCNSQCESILTIHLLKKYFKTYFALFLKKSDFLHSQCDNIKYISLRAKSLTQNLITFTLSLTNHSQCEPRFLFLNTKPIHITKANFETGCIFNIYYCIKIFITLEVNQKHKKTLKQCESSLLMIQHFGFALEKTMKALKQCETNFSTGSMPLNLYLKQLSLGKLFIFGTKLSLLPVSLYLTAVRAILLFLLLPYIYLVCTLNMRSIK